MAEDASHRGIQVTAFTHRGKVRARNEDAIAVGPWQAMARMETPWQSVHPLEPPVLCLVADGMGGHAAGDHASTLAARSLAERAPRVTCNDDVASMLRAANREVFAATEERSDRRGMGTTAAGCIFAPDAVRWFNVGDSRIYRFRDGFARQLSIDDVSAGPWQDATQSHVITQALGGTPTLQEITPHVGSDPLVSGWCYLLCSDGLTDHLDTAGMEEILAAEPSDRAAVETLFQSAMGAGGNDNVSILLARVVQTTAIEAIRS